MQHMVGLTVQRYAYFLAAGDLAHIKDKLHRDGLNVKSVHGAPCVALRYVPRTAFIAAPDVWSALCRRQGSWYRTSIYDGTYLLVTPAPQPGLRGVSIVECDFHPPRLPTEEDLVDLVADEAYQDLCPKEWTDIRPDDIQQILGFRSRLSSKVPTIDPCETFEHLFLYHCANHANFISPRFFVEIDGRCAPYAIAGTGRVCSSCLETFDVVGSAHQTKYVMPCPGAVSLAGLIPDRYLKIEQFC